MLRDMPFFRVGRTVDCPLDIVKREAADNDLSETDSFLVPVSIIRAAISDRDVLVLCQL